MAGDWIKVRPSLLTSPKLNGIARIIEGSREAGQCLTTGFNGEAGEVITRNALRYVTLASLVTVWGAANEHTRDGVFANTDLHDIDDIAGVPGFGRAMEAVGWAIYDEEENTVTLPNFNEWNTCGQSRSRSSAAERQRRYRERQKEQPENGDVTRDVTSDVTSNGREEKRREETTTIRTSAAAESGSPDGEPRADLLGDSGTGDRPPPCPHQRIVDLYHELCPMLPRVAVLNGARKASIRARWTAELPTLDKWRTYFGVVASSSFLTGRCDPTGGRSKPFMADFDFLIRPSTAVKVIEGKYDD